MSTEPRTKGAHYMYGLDLMRVVCSVAVVYTHVALWARHRGHGFALIDVVDNAIIAPLHLAENLSYVGVTAFFLITGVVVTHVSFTESRGQFLARRAVRLLPALWLAVPFAWLLVYYGFLLEPKQPDAADLVLGMLLLDGAVPGTIRVLGVTWTLAIQVLFYFFTAATLPLLKRWPWLPAAIGASLVMVLISLTAMPQPGPSYQFRMAATFLPVIFIGQAIMLVRSRAISPRVGLLLGTVHLGLCIHAMLTWAAAERIGYLPRTVVLLSLVLILLTRVDGPASRSLPVKLIADRTYLIYLLHLPVLFAVFHFLAAGIGFASATAIGLLVLAAVVELVHRTVEQPIVRAYRRAEAARSGRGAAPVSAGGPPGG